MYLFLDLKHTNLGFFRLLLLLLKYVLDFRNLGQSSLLIAPPRPEGDQLVGVKHVGVEHTAGGSMIPRYLKTTRGKTASETFDEQSLLN